MFHFYFRSDPTTYYAFDSSGNVITTQTKTPVQYAPKNWENMAINWQRHAVFMGMFRSLTPQFDFVLDSRDIIRHVYYTQGVEGALFIDIELQSDQDYSWSHFYTGRVDLSTLQDKEFFISVNIIEVGLKAYLDSNSKQVYNIPLDQVNPNISKVLIDGIFLNEVVKWYPSFDSFTMDTGSEGWLMPPSVSVERESTIPVCISRGQDRGVLSYITVGQQLQPEFSTSFFYEALIPQTIDFYINESYGFSLSGAIPSATAEVYLVVVSVNGIITQNFQLDSQYASDKLAHNLVVTKNVTGINLNQGDYLYLVFGTKNFNGNFYLQVNPNATNSNIYYHSVTVYGKYPVNGLKCMKYMDVLNELIYRMTTGRYTGDNTSSYSGYSDYMTNLSNLTYDCYPAGEVITSGSALKNFKTLGSEAPQSIKSSFDQMFNDLQSTFSLSLGIDKDGSGNDRIRVEPIDYFLDNSTMIADLGIVSGLIVKPAMEYLFNAADFGQGSYSYDQNNYYGRWEYFGTYNWLFPYVFIDKKLSKVSPYRSDCIGIELARFGIIDSPDDVFVIDCHPVNRGPNGEFMNYRPANAQLTTVDPVNVPVIPSGQTFYNFGRSPRRSVLRNGRFLHSVLDLRDNWNAVVIGTNVLNYVVVYTDGIHTYTEYDHFQISTLPPQLFKPIIFTFEAITDVNIANLMNQNPRGYFQFEWNGQTYKGFPMKIGVNISNYKSYECELLVTPDTIIESTKI